MFVCQIQKTAVRIVFTNPTVCFKTIKVTNKDTSEADNSMKIEGFLLISGGKTTIVFKFEK